ncbi:MAG: RsmE family RNA methyltransferase [Halanaerobiales bacterium]|nr:RsmE family RNA methyltransferase [Halanaerobiales bacterium]
MHRFFVKSNYVNNNVVEIRGNDFNHISNSLRLKPEDKIIITIGDGYDYIVELKEFTDKAVFGNIIDKSINKSEPKIKVDLAQAIPKNRNIELVIQKGTEMGVNNIIPLDTERTIVKLTPSKEKRRLKRWQKIAQEAAKQSQRGKIPEIKDLFSVNDNNKLQTLFSKYDLILVLYAGKANKSMKNILKKYKDEKLKKILILIGPEGGFSSEEIELFKNNDLNNNVEIVTLGTRILRTETAGLTALTSVMYEFDELGGK